MVALLNCTMAYKGLMSKFALVYAVYGNKELSELTKILLARTDASLQQTFLKVLFLETPLIWTPAACSTHLSKDQVSRFEKDNVPCSGV